ncbi:hypothetical protein, partial [Endozoicomonas acroporae]|uniref:hypothetical protein n=1 Tax=Endozoicomonas acroporae TaxID=1701104 RepID=UPI001C6098BF
GFASATMGLPNTYSSRQGKNKLFIYSLAVFHCVAVYELSQKPSPCAWMSRGSSKYLVTGNGNGDGEFR